LEIAKIQLISNHICFGPEPQETDEVEQHLTIREDGMYWLTRYHYGTGEKGYRPFEKKIGKMIPGRAGEIFADLEQYLNRDILCNMVLDCGDWNLTVWFKDGTKIGKAGALVQDDQLSGISDKIRVSIDASGIYAFDANIW